MVVTPRRELFGANELAHRQPLIGVQRPERLVHQVDGRAPHHRARERHLLLIAARELLRIKRQQALEVHPRGDGIDPGLDVGGLGGRRRAAGTRCCRGRSGADRARRTGTPSRRRAARGEAASRHARRDGWCRRSQARGRQSCASVVVLPQPEGPRRTMNSPCSIGEVDPVHRPRAVGVGLLDPFERQKTHAASLFPRLWEV